MSSEYEKIKNEFDKAYDMAYKSYDKHEKIIDLMPSAAEQQEIRQAPTQPSVANANIEKGISLYEQNNVTNVTKGGDEKIIDLALKGYTAKYIAKNLELDIIKVTDLMPSTKERQEIRQARATEDQQHSTSLIEKIKIKQAEIKATASERNNLSKNIQDALQC